MAINPFGQASNVTTSQVKGLQQPGFYTMGGPVAGYQISPDKTIASWADPNTGQSYSSESVGGQQGAWTDAGGVKYRNLPGFLNSEESMRKGSDFSSYQNSLADLLRDPSKVQQTAGYQFALDQGNQAINRSAAAKGMLNSGNVLAELAKFGQGMASQQYDTEVNRLANLMRGAQNFGISSGYYDPKRYIATPGGTNPEYYISNV